MSNAMELLKGMTDEQIAAYSANPQTEPHIVIGSDRKITVPETLKRIAVQFDHNVETVTFDCPRYWDEHDLSQMAIYVNYVLPDGTPDSYPAKNVSASGDTMTFTWTINDNLTQHKGNITFLVCAKKVDSEGILTNHWNSELCTDMFISEGLETTQQIAEEYHDLITELLLRMDSVEKINIQASEMYELHDWNVELSEAAQAAKVEAVAAKEAVEASAEEIRNTYANAIVNSASGQVIRVDDVSPIEHDVKVKVRSKNLAARTSTKTEVTADGVTFVVNDDGTVTANGTATATAYYLMQIGTGWTSQVPIKKGRYTIGLAPAQGCRISLGLRYSEDVERTLYYSTFTNTISFDVTSDNARFDIILCVDAGYTVTDTVFEPLLVEGDVADEYIPYVDPTAVTVTACGKNIFKFAGKTQTLNGVTCTANADGTVTVNGTAEKATFFGIGNIYPVIGAKHRLSGCPSGGDFDTYILYIHNNTTGADIYDLGSGKTFVGKDGNQGLTIAVYAGTTVDNLTFYPMVTIGEEAEEFEPYTGSSYTTSSYGSVEGVKSVSPTMTVHSNKSGALLDVKYNKDINAAFDELNTLLETFLNGGA